MFSSLKFHQQIPFLSQVKFMCKPIALQCTWFPSSFTEVLGLGDMTIYNNDISNYHDLALSMFYLYCFGFSLYISLVLSIDVNPIFVDGPLGLW